MNPAVDLATLPGPAQKILDGSAPLPIRQMAAKGIAPGLRPVDALTIIALLAESSDEALATSAQSTLANLPAPVIKGALGGVIPPGVLDALAPRYAKNPEVIELILRQAGLQAETVLRVAEIANEAVTELIAVNEERLLQHPEIIEKLYLNNATRMSTADRMIELAVRNGLVLTGIAAFKEAAEAIAGELIAEASEEPTPDDILFRQIEETAQALDIDPSKEDVVQRDDETGDETVSKRVLPLHAQLSGMSISQKIRRAMLGTGRRTAPPRARQEQTRGRRGHPQPEDPGERGGAHLAEPKRLRRGPPDHRHEQDVGTGPPDQGEPSDEPADPVRLLVAADRLFARARAQVDRQEQERLERDRHRGPPAAQSPSEEVARRGRAR